MNSDATEAALGLLGLSPLNASQSHPHPQPLPHNHVAHTHGPSLTSTSVGVAVDRTTATHMIPTPLPPSLVPLKRKQPSPALSSPLSPSITRDGLPAKPRQPSHPLATSSIPPMQTKSLPVPVQRHLQQQLCPPIITTSASPQTPPTSQLPLASPSTSQHPLAFADVPPPPDSDAISCICGFTYDDGFSIACDDCSRWCHAACFGIVQGGEVPEFWKCWVCDPTVQVDRERAVKIQKGRLRAMRTKASHGMNGGSGPAAVNGVGGHLAADEAGKPMSRRKASPGAERKSRRGSAVAAAIEGSGSSRKKRRASILSPVDPSSPSIPPPNHPMQSPAGSSRISYPNGNGPVTSNTLPPTPVTFPPDIYPNPSVYSQLLRVAKAWRGVTALNPPLPLLHPPKTYNDGGYMRVDSQGYRDRYGYSMSPLDNTTPVILDENAGDVCVPRTVLRTDSLCTNSTLQCPPPSTCTPAHLRPPSPKLHVASDPSPFPHPSIYPSPPISSYMSPVPITSHPRPCAKSPLTPSTNFALSSSPNDTIPATTLLAPYTATIIPSAAYLADSLNGYAHLGMGKPQVRLIGGGWGVELDARGTGGAPDTADSSHKTNENGVGKEDAGEGKARWARCGCWPNAVIRPVICNGMKRRKGKKGQGMQGIRHKPECAKAASDDGAVPADVVQPMNGRSVPPPMLRLQAQETDEVSDQDDTHSTSDSDADPTSLSFALFALRDLRADEEIVLGWEWDDGHAVHMLPALMESPGLFAPAHLHHLRAQFTSILHALSSTFTTCACGSSTRDCAVRVMESVVEGRWPWPGEEMTEESEGDSSDVGGESGECDDGEIDVEGDGHLDPRSGRNYGLGMNVDVDVDIEMDTSVEVDRRTRRVKKRKVRKKHKSEDVVPVDRGKKADVAVSTTKARKVIDLGPLVSVKRGFRTREKEPMNGGWGGVEIVPSSLRPFPPLRGEEDTHLDGKGKARAVEGEDGTDVYPSPSALPPRMRKAWAPFPAAQPESRLPDHSTSTERWRTHERWRSPPEMNPESPMSVSGVGEGRGEEDATKPASVSGDGVDSVDGQETEFDTETEADGMDDTRQMPPPPMPASLDPTTVSSLVHATRSSSPRGSIQRDKNGVAATRIPPRTPTPTSAASGRPSQPLDQGSGTPVPSNSNVVSSLPSQANSLALPTSTSFPLATQAPAPSRPSAPHSHHLTPSVSPSATFSKLSLHSPDASSPHVSVLFSPSESTSLSSTLQRVSDLRARSPPFHKPSKPLHVHPQNESRSFSTSVSAPVVTLSSPDGMRDTPAEAQYQQPYRSSPESRYETDSLPDVDKKRHANHVRFASPEMLSGFPGLKGKTMQNNSGPEDGHSEAMSQEAVPSLDRDAMDIDVVGDNESDASLPTEASENKANHPDYKCSSLYVPGSPLSQPPSTRLRRSPPSATDSAAPESHPSPPGSMDGTGSLVEPISIDSEPAHLAREPSPPPPPKVKMSLKDFALRKKKQREEEMAAKALYEPATPDKAGLPSSPSLDVEKDLAGDAGQVADPGSAVNGHAVEVNGVTKDDVPDSLGNIQDKIHDFGRTADKGTVALRPPTMVQMLSLFATSKTVETTHSSPPPLDSSTALPRVLDEEHDMDQTQKVGSKPPAILTAKMEIMDAMFTNGPAGTDDCTPDVVSFAPEPPPPPLTIKQTSETAVEDRAVPANSVPQSVTFSNPVPSSALTSMSTSTSTSAANSRSNSVSLPASISNPTPQLHHHFPIPSSIPPSRRPSHEDGEITSSTPPKTYLPRSHTPPTQPRSFNATHPPSPNFAPTSTSTMPVPRRPVPPLSRSPLSNAAGPPSTPTSSRPLPSGPRALRGSMTQSTHTPPYSSTRPPYAGSQYIPRGPSADRDRIDWDRDRPWVAQTRSRGRAGSNGWGR